ncbi:hypothetical protein MesoLj113a_36370 [Mesorhizobium sp. 113-1-2]|nr:hypothetical protein MesoLj113a_36370 [Mesorhizobium sp. 113-1-2]
MIEGPRQRTPHAFVILGRSDAKRRADPRIHAVTLVGGRKRLRMPAKQCGSQGALFRTVGEHRDNGMDPRVCAASLRSLLRPRMTKRTNIASAKTKALGLRFAPATLSPVGRGGGASHG